MEVSSTCWSSNLGPTFTFPPHSLDFKHVVHCMQPSGGATFVQRAVRICQPPTNAATVDTRSFFVGYGIQGPPQIFWNFVLVSFSTHCTSLWIECRLAILVEPTNWNPHPQGAPLSAARESRSLSFIGYSRFVSPSYYQHRDWTKQELQAKWKVHDVKSTSAYEIKYDNKTI